MRVGESRDGERREGPGESDTLTEGVEDPVSRWREENG